MVGSSYSYYYNQNYKVCPIVLMNLEIFLLKYQMHVHSMTFFWKKLVCFYSGLCITCLQKSESFYMTEDFNYLNFHNGYLYDDVITQVKAGTR